ncbi:hypothetical protein AAFF_G00301260 [Aldrovandia affinis]|uniref:Ig-like domain-containing protein n=1 Tax=Aldrovandia affinis TaxID=143900 RepID=A0AAD7SQZ1_9TELE|nr:hypothetical protein AAFF_G00301260 [Aldrovandia affinis]
MERACYVLTACIMSLLEFTGAISVQQSPPSLFGNPRDDVQLTCEHDDSSYQYMYCRPCLHFVSTDVQCQSQQKVSQWPSQTVVAQGSSVELQCSQSGSDTYMYWYLQQRSAGIQLIIHSAYMSEPERGKNTSDRFTSNRPKLENITLRISQAEESDTDVQCQSQQKVSQWPSQTVVAQGSSVELQCSQSGSDTYMYWYLQQRSARIQLIIHSAYMSEPERGKNTSDRFTSNRPKLENITLRIIQAEESDTDGESLLCTHCLHNISVRVHRSHQCAAVSTFSLWKPQ